MKKICPFVFTFLFVSFNCFSQIKDEADENFKTSQYAGKYVYDEYGMGEVLVYPESDTTVLFYIQLVSGRPSHNMGDLYGRLTLVDGQGVFERKSAYSAGSCKWSMTFTNNKLIIKTLEDQYECGFGMGVVADDEYTRKSSEIPEYFIDFTGTKQYFSKLNNEEWQ